jgi:hypothetical protein
LLVAAQAELDNAEQLRNIVLPAQPAIVQPSPTPTDTMYAPPVLLPACANWIPGAPPCESRGRRVCGNCKLVVVSTSPFLATYDTQKTLTK